MIQDPTLTQALLVSLGVLAGTGLLLYLFRRGDRVRQRHLAAVLARQPVRAGEAFRLGFARSTGEALTAYLRVDLEYPGIEGAYRVRCVLRAHVAGRVVVEEVLGAWGDLRPVQGVTCEWTRRYYLGTRPWKDGYRDSLVLELARLDPGPPGEEVAIEGTLEAERPTVIRDAEVYLVPASRGL